MTDRYALRALSRSPGFTATAVLTLAVGIAANTTVMTVVDGGLRLGELIARVVAGFVGPI